MTKPRPGARPHTIYTDRSINSALWRARAEDNEIPRSGKHKALAAACRKRYGSWNQILFDTFGQVNTFRSNSYSEEDLIGLLNRFMVENKRHPLRSEFDGHSWPYWECYTRRFKVKKWSEILALAKETKNYPANNHGFGKSSFHNGIYFKSIKEKEIACFLESNKWDYEYEPEYGDGKYSFDFYVPEYDYYIEYYGIKTKDYLERIEAKRLLYGDRVVFEIFKDLSLPKQLRAFKSIIDDIEITRIRNGDYSHFLD